jgi:hypothetical protein
MVLTATSAPQAVIGAGRRFHEQMLPPTYYSLYLGCPGRRKRFIVTRDYHYLALGRGGFTGPGPVSFSKRVFLTHRSVPRNVMTPITTLLIATSNHSVSINAITTAASVPTPIAVTMRLIEVLAESFGSRSYGVACASFATSIRTSPLSRAFSFVNWRPRLSTSRRSPNDIFFPSRSRPLIFFGASSPS